MDTDARGFPSGEKTLDSVPSCRARYIPCTGIYVCLQATHDVVLPRPNRYWLGNHIHTSEVISNLVNILEPRQDGFRAQVAQVKENTTIDTTSFFNFGCF